MDEGTKTLVDAAELARIVGLPEASVRRLARKGELPALRFGRLWRFDVDRVMAALEQQPAGTAVLTIPERRLA